MNDNTTNTILSSVSTAFGLTGLIDPDEIRGWVSLIISIISLAILLINIIKMVIKKIKKAKEDGVITDWEKEDIINTIKGGANDVVGGVNDVKDKIDDLKDKEDKPNDR